MKIKAIYVYATSKIKSAVDVESMRGEVYKAGEIKLPPGTYRAQAGFDVTPLDGNAAVQDYDIIIQDGHKTIIPDPPQGAPGGTNTVKAFLSGAGAAGTA